MSMDVTLLEEIAEQDLTQASGGLELVPADLSPAVASILIGNKGFVCTATAECQPICK